MRVAIRVFVAIVVLVGATNVRAADSKPATIELPRPELTIRLPKGEKAGLVLFSPDGSKIAITWYAGRTLQLVDSHRGIVQQTFSGHTKTISSLAFSLNGKRLVSGGRDGTVRIWNTSSGKEERRIAVADEALVSVAISPDGKAMAIGCATTFEHVDSSSGKTERSFGGEGSLQVQQLADGKALPEFSSKGRAVFAVAYSPDGKILAAESYWPIDIWDTAARKITRTLANDETSFLIYLVFSRDGDSLVTENTGACSYAVAWELDLAAKTAPIQYLGPPGTSSGQMFILPDDKTILGHAKEGIYVFDREIHKPRASQQKRSELLEKKEEFERAYRQPLGILACGKALQIARMDVSPDAKQLVASLDDGTVRLWDLTAALKSIRQRQPKPIGPRGGQDTSR